MKTRYLQRDNEPWHESNDTVDTAWKQIKWWHNANRVGAQKTSLLAQFTAVMTASQCWPSGCDTKSYNWRKEGRGRGRESRRVMAWAGCKWAADTNRGSAQGLSVPAKQRVQYIRLKWRWGYSTGWIMANGSRMSARPSHLMCLLLSLPCIP